MTRDPRLPRPVRHHATRRSTTRGSRSSTRCSARAQGAPPRAAPAAAVAASSPASTRAATSSAACTRRRPTRSCCGSPRFETNINNGAAGRAQPRGHQRPALLRGPRQPRLGRAHDELATRSGSTSTCAGSSSTSSTRSTRRTQWAVFEPNNERLWAQHPAAPIEDFLLVQWQNGALLGDQAGGGVLRALRPHDDDPERPRQRAAHLPDRRRARSSPPSS